MLPRTSAEIDSFLEAHGLAPLARYGQNFLVHAGALDHVADAGGTLSGRVVLEIGPGLGALTTVLLERGARVVAAEIDGGYCSVLREAFAQTPHFTLVAGDCLEGRVLAPRLLEMLAQAGAWTEGYLVISNLPYQISSPFLAALPHMAVAPERVVLTLQKEVARALRAAPGSEYYTPLSLLARLCFKVELLRTLPANCFYPQPDVESAVVRLTPLPVPADLDGLLTFGRALLGNRRQTLRRTLLRAYAALGLEVSQPQIQSALTNAKLDGDERADVLEVAQILSLFHSGCGQ
ncbi:MAG: ribosomal RNA small subunit methyltransferase A [Planctomycetes bacterium]|nr:ribosomal RNA small subunit methyltransferase A [Planctomycetota bacterium]